MVVLLEWRRIMKKRVWIVSAILWALLLSGCSGTDAEKQAVVRELPIEQAADEMAEMNTETDMSSEAVRELSKEPYEEIQVEVNGNKGTILVGTTGAPFTELLTQAKILSD